MSEFTGKKLKEARVKKGLSQDEAANLLNVHIAKLNGRICGAKRSHSVFEQPNCYQSV